MMIIISLFIFFISLGASFATDTDTNIADKDNNEIINTNTNNKNSNISTTTQTNTNSNKNSNNTSITNNNPNTKYKAAGELTKLSQNQILVASKKLNSYINKNKRLPNYITISNTKFSMPEYMYLLSITIYNRYNKKTSAVSIKYNVKNPGSPNGVTIKGKLTKAQYYSYAKSIGNYIKKYNKAPNYVSTKLGKIQYQTALYMLNKIAYYSATHKGNLASTVTLKISRTHAINRYLPKYARSQTNTNSNTGSTNTGSNSKTLSQSNIWAASTSVKNYADKNGKLPNYVAISGYNYSMPEFLYILSKAINTRVGSSSSSAIAVRQGVKNPSSPSGSTISKTFTKAQYNDMAKRMANYISSNNKAPNYLSSSYGVGNIQYQTAIYGLSCVGNYINTKKAIPTTLTIKIASSNSINKYLPVYGSSSTNNSANNSSSNGLNKGILGSDDKGSVELIGAFGNINSNIKIAYVIGLHPLESAVHNTLYNAITTKTNLKYCYYIYRINVIKNPSDYNEGRMNGQLLAQKYVLPHIISNDFNFVIDIHSNQGTVGGNYEETNFIFAPLNHSTSKAIAETIISKIPELTYYYPASQTSPTYLTNPLVQAGIPTILYETYMYEDISVTNDLINKLITQIDTYNFASLSIDSSGTLSLNSIIDAASRVKAYVETNGVLPNYVTIGTTQYNMQNFLYLLSTAIVNINSGSNKGVKPLSVSAAANPNGVKVAGTFTKSDYVDIASRVSTYIATNKQAPNYASSNLGNIQFESLVYELSKVLNYVNINGILPNTLTINTSKPNTLNGGSSSSNSSLSGYLKATKNCQVTNANIQALAKQLTSGLTSDLAKATAIFNYVRDNIKYNFYYNSLSGGNGAVGALNRKWANCVDQTHLLIALLRASGIPARYVNGEATFSKGRYGHVWAEVYIDGVWVIADTTSSNNKLGTITNWNRNTAKVYSRYAEITF